MTLKLDHYLDIDFAQTECESELVVSIRTTDGSKLSQQDALDGFMAALEEAYNQPAVKPLTKKQLANDPDLH